MLWLCISAKQRLPVALYAQLFPMFLIRIAIQVSNRSLVCPSQLIMFWEDRAFIHLLLCLVQNFAWT